MFKRSLKSWGLVCALTLATVGVAQATTLPAGRVEASCSSYKVTFDARGFVDPGDAITVTFRIVMFSGSETRVENHQETITGTGDFPAVFEYPWNPAVCGMWTFLEGGADGSRYDWVNNTGNGSAEAIMITAPPSKILDCTCTEEPPVVEVCRDPGFWGTHAGTAVAGSQDVTGAVLGASADGSLFICGRYVDTLTIGTVTSLEEALCVRGRHDRKAQLARELAATALNCVISGAGDDCAGMSIETIYQQCNDQCATSNGDLSDCIDRLSCFNDGGVLLDSGMCQVGTCSDDGDPCNDDSDCRSGRGRRGCRDDNSARCNPTPGNCADRPLVNTYLGLDFDPLGPAGSRQTCNDAERNDCTIFGCVNDTGGGGCGGGGNHDGHHSGHNHGGHH